MAAPSPITLPRLLIVNPNISSGITDLMVRAGQARAGGRARVTGVTARFGAASLECDAELVIAGHAVLDAIAVAPPADVIIIGAFGDPALAAAAELLPVPVIGLAQAGLLAAAGREAGAGDSSPAPRRFAILTLGPRLEPAIRRAVADSGLTEALADLRFLPGSVLEVAADRDRFTDWLLTEAARAIADHGAEAILFGGAPFAGIGAELGARISVPVFDGLTSAIDRALRPAFIRPGVPPPGDGPGKRHAGLPLGLIRLVSGRAPRVEFP